MDINNDEMIECMRERLSDDLWERYELEELDAYDDIYDKATKNGKIDWFETKEAEVMLIKEWKKDIKLFKQKCKKLGYNEEEINKVVESIIKDGCKYLQINEKEVN